MMNRYYREEILIRTAMVIAGLIVLMILILTNN